MYNVQAILRILIGAVLLLLLRVFESALARTSLLIAAAAAGSTALYGFGFRSAGLSAFRLLSHLAAYALFTYVAAAKLAVSRRKLKAARAIAAGEG